MDEWRFVLLQLCDSGFPSGAFSHSFGFETYVQEGRITDSRTFRGWLEAYLRRQWIYNEGLALRLAYEALDRGDSAPLEVRGRHAGAEQENAPHRWVGSPAEQEGASPEWGGSPVEREGVMPMAFGPPAEPDCRMSVASGPLAESQRRAGTFDLHAEPDCRTPVANDLPAVELDHPTPEALDLLWEIDRRMTVQTIPYESRSGAVRMGRRMLELVRKLWTDMPALAEYAAQIDGKRCHGHAAIVFAIVCRRRRVPLREALLHFAYASTVPLVQNGVRAIPLGQTDGQALIAGLHAVWAGVADAVAGLDPDDFGISPPGLELAAIRHERLDGRMFMS